MEQENEVLLKKNSFFRIEFWKTPLASLLTLMTLVGIYSFYSTTKTMESIGSLEKGTTICFNRVQQSFLSYVVGDLSGNNLNKSFFDLTQQCFGDVVKALESVSLKKKLEVKEQANVLSTEVYWFHRVLSSESAPLDNDSIDEKYYKSEVQKYELMDLLQEEAVSITKKQNRWGAFFAFSLFSLITIILFDWQKKRQFIKTIHSINESARREIEKETPPHAMRVSEILKMNLYETGSFYSYALFKKYNDYLLETTLGIKKSLIDQKENDSLTDILIFDQLNELVTTYKNEFFAKGIRIDLNIPDSLKILGIERITKKMMTILFNESTHLLDSFESDFKEIILKVEEIKDEVVVMKIEIGKLENPYSTGLKEFVNYVQDLEKLNSLLVTYGGEEVLEHSICYKIKFHNSHFVEDKKSQATYHQNSATV